MLPTERKESIFDKIKNFFKNIFKGKNPEQETYKEESRHYSKKDNRKSLRE